MGTTHLLRSRLRVFIVTLAVVMLVPVAVLAAGGRFTDDDNSLFERDIEWLAAEEITFGCNPPTNDRFCPDENVTRGQMAAFMHRFANSQGNTAYQVGNAAKMDIEGVDMYATVMELTGLPEGSYFVTAKGEFHSSEIMTEAHPTCVLMAGHEFDTASPSVAPGQTVPWTATALTYMGEDNGVMHIDCRDHGEMVSLYNVRLTAISVNSIEIQYTTTIP